MTPTTTMGGASVLPTDRPSNARLIAELQAVQIGLVIVGGDLNRLPEVMGVGQDNGPPLGLEDDPYDDFDPEADEDEDDGLDGCGLMADGQCALAGTEWCDWDCPRDRLALRQSTPQIEGEQP